MSPAVEQQPKAGNVNVQGLWLSKPNWAEVFQKIIFTKK